MRIALIHHLRSGHDQILVTTYSNALFNCLLLRPCSSASFRPDASNCRSKAICDTNHFPRGPDRFPVHGFNTLIPDGRPMERTYFFIPLSAALHFLLTKLCDRVCSS